ncbi:MFS transporter [Acidianus sp. HS-5]|uniref:MFS transporter n=1 Tax=Acidianus sp. HS-5 TaxID=2886040 RepID=UPI001EFFB5C7|nr:MFS transporter [Acidianus sp. HS-5]BDC18836.1 MFS transporter [Acidianus sp. HS-5]
MAKSIKSPKSKDVITRYDWFIFGVALAGWTLASMDLNLYSINLPFILSDFHISLQLGGVITSIIFAGATIVVWALGPLLDSYGRKTVWQISLIFTALFTGFTIFAYTVVLLTLVRVLADGFSYIEFPTGITIANEQFPEKHRGSMYGWVQGGFPLGYFLAVIISYLVEPYFGGPYAGWRYAFLIGIVPIVVVIIMRLWVKEPERADYMLKAKKLVKEGKIEEAKKLLEKYNMDLSQIANFTYKQMFTDPKLKKQSIVTTLAEVSHEFATPALFFFTSTALIYYKHFPPNLVFITLAIATFLAFLGYGIMGHIGQRIGRKKASVIIGLIGGASVIFFALSSGYLATIISTLLFYPLVLSWNGTWWSYIADTFPTRVRGTAESWQVGLNDFAWVIGSLVYGFVITGIGFTLTYIFFAAVPVFLGAVVVGLFGKHADPNAKLEDIAW